MRGSLSLAGLAFILNISAATGATVQWNDFRTWFPQQQQRSLIAMFKNISPANTMTGTVIASPQKEKPDYFYHWVRDAALVMDAVFEFHKRTRYPDSKAKSYQLLQTYAAHSRQNQLNAATNFSFGEPKFFVDGRVYDGPWARPQNDGPALRAITLTKFAHLLLNSGQEPYVREYLYDSILPSNSVIKADLDYVAARWRDKNFDLWEEVGGDHFYNRMVQRRALLEGARLAETLKDMESAGRYKAQAQNIADELKKHWDPARGKIIPTFNQFQGPHKPTLLDSAVILGVLHGELGDGFYNPSDDKVLSTAMHLKTAFQRIYEVNRKPDGIGIGIGRYPEDNYNGTDGQNLLGSEFNPEDSHKGNPWFLTTLALGELYYRAGEEFRNKGEIKITHYNLAFFQNLMPDEVFEVNNVYQRGNDIFNSLLLIMRKAGDAQLIRCGQHMDQKTGSMAEQFNRKSGFMESASDLTWSYAAFLTASWRRPDFERMQLRQMLR